MDSEKISSLAKAVITIEASMISQLVDRVNQQFIDACRYLYDCEGRIAVMGMGKSGHIGKKIAATFASTGTPAFFIHPSEAKHGDVGMITRKDVVLALSNSGESEEIIALLPYFKRFNIPLIALTGKPTSTLAKAANVNIDASVEKEACPLGLAPTSSTTAALVMGDALAMALLDKRGFTEADFAISHPGGALGRKLLTQVADIMHPQSHVPVVLETASLKEALVEMSQKKFGLTTVVNNAKQLVGIFTDGDVRRALDNKTDIHLTTMNDIMSKSPKTIAHNLLASEALNMMETHKITALVVTNESEHPIGILHIHDLLRAGVV